MSLLMEALKKAEQGKQPPAEPSLVTAQPAALDDNAATATQLDLPDDQSFSSQTTANADVGVSPLDTHSDEESPDPLSETVALCEGFGEPDPPPADDPSPGAALSVVEQSLEDLNLDLPDDLVIDEAIDEAEEFTGEAALEIVPVEPEADKTSTSETPCEPAMVVEPSPLPISAPAPATEPATARPSAEPQEPRPDPVPTHEPATEQPSPSPAVIPRPAHQRKNRPRYWAWGAAAAVCVLLGGGGYGYLQWQLADVGAIAPAGTPPPMPAPQPHAAPAEATPDQPAPTAQTDTSSPGESAAVVDAANIDVLPAPAPKATLPPVTTASAPVETLNNPTPPAPATKRPASQPATTATPKTEPPADSPPLQIVRQQQEDPLYTSLNSAYAAYQSGDLAAAEAQYLSALNRESDNRDALMGLAAVAQRTGDVEHARRYYNRLLSLNPKDSMAISGLMALAPSGTALENESRVKLLLDDEPEAAHLHFALGTQYVAQNRWPEAQQAFFDAYRRAPDNANYAFNLAVSLDRLGQPGAALPYYQRALRQADSQPIAFDRTAVSRRLAHLQGKGVNP